MTTPIAPDDLAAILKREYAAADDFYEQLEELQRAAFEYYEAQPFGNEIDGRSQVVLPDVQEACDGMLGILLKMFVSGDRVVEFESTEEEHEQHADDATVAIDYLFMRKQDGYRVLNDVGMDGLQRKIGIFKAVCEEEEKVSRSWVLIEDELQLGMIEGEVENLRENDDGTFKALIKSQKIVKRHSILAIPTKEYRFSPRAAHEDSADYQAHVRPVTRSDLVEMRFDRDQAYSLPAYGAALVEKQESNKLDSFCQEESSPALEQVLLCEEYARIDVDGDGIAEQVKVYRVENEILIDAETGKPAIETIDEQPFSVWCPFPRQHRLVGYSLADKIMDLQLLRSHFARQLIDGMAFANMPRPIVSESGSSDETLDDILNPIPGSPIRVRSIDAVTALPSNFNIGDSLQSMEWVSREKEGRSGIGRSTPTLDENTLNNQTATEFAGRESKGETAQEYIARNMAEALGRSFGKLYRRMRVEAEPFQIRVDGKYRQIDPALWPEDMNLRIRVGLGTGNKDKRVQARSALMQPLTLAVEQGMSSAEHVFKWFDGMARDTGIGQGEDFMFDPASEEGRANAAQKAQQPDPELAAKQAEIAAKAEEAQAKLALQREEAGAKLEALREEYALKAELERDKADFEARLAAEKMQREFALAERKMAMEAQLAERKAEREASMSTNRPGGDLSE